MQLATKTLGPAEKNTHLSRGMQFTDGWKYHVPIGASEIGWGAESSDGIFVCICIIDHDIGSIIGFDLRCQILWARSFSLRSCDDDGRLTVWISMRL